MMKKEFVSRGLLGPMKGSHQPWDGFCWVEAACEEAERPVWRRMTLSFLGERVPQDS